jgi:formamidopyrimidine-DNA glycosylase
MPELPEIHNLAKQMNRKLRGLMIGSAEVVQRKCLNMPPARFSKMVCGKVVGPVSSRGKWIFAKVEPDAWVLLSLGMGGDAFYHKPGEALPERYQVAFRFTDGSELTIRFWWFGYVHAATDGQLPDHPMTASLGLNPLSKREFTYERFLQLLEGRKGAVKPFLLDQKHIAGIGNVYVQDILFRAGLHPNRRIPEISPDEKGKLYAAIIEHVGEAARLRGLAYEKDLFGRPGRFKEFAVGYREGQECPQCGTTIEKIRTGTTASYICPACQT